MTGSLSESVLSELPPHLRERYFWMQREADEAGGGDDQGPLSMAQADDDDES